MKVNEDYDNIEFRVEQSLMIVDNSGIKIETTDVISKVKDFLRAGKIIAIKNIGGFHLCCDGENKDSIGRLRDRKKRPDKPLAIMVKGIEKVKEICHVSHKEEEILTNNKRPIVLLEKKNEFKLPDNISPVNNRVGVMLPYTNTHLLILTDNIEYLVMTSGNVSKSPIQYKNEEAIENLKDIADYILLNDREITIPIDDTIVKIINNDEMILRLGRNYSPMIVNIDTKDNIKEILSFGSEMKGSFCFSKNGYSYLSKHIGDLSNLDNINLYKKNIKRTIDEFDICPKLITHDLHNGYNSTSLAKEFNTETIPIQHHHAHMASCMGEHNLYEDVIGVIYDGTGLGLDGTIWGGEFLVGNRRDFKRVGHLKNITIQGGDSAIRDIWKIGLSYLLELGIEYKDIFDENDPKVKLVKCALENKLNCFETSSMGRLFDSVSSLIGLRESTTYDGQGAMELECILDESIEESYDFSISCNDNKDKFQIDYIEIIKGIVEDIKYKNTKESISTKFHNTIIDMTIKGITYIKKKHNLNTVVLSGGVFQNSYLLKKVYEELTRNNFNVFYNKKIPIDDSGISFGQLTIAEQLLIK